MIYIECPNTIPDPLTCGRRNSLFLGGGISGCPDWQQEMRSLLSDTELILVNPRRKDFPMDDPKAARRQIEWEHFHLKRCNARLFWFPCETLCPITLFELGKWLSKERHGTLFVGCHSDYKRRIDVEIQVELEQPCIEVFHSLESLAAEVGRCL